MGRNTNIIDYDYSHRGERILAADLKVSNDTRMTGLNNNDLVIGPSGSGKTGGYVIPNLQNPDGSMIVSDTKGRLGKLFTKELKDKGYKVHTLDFVNPKRSVAYNPLMFVKRYNDGRINEKDVNTIVSAIHPMTLTKEPYWDLSARRYITMLIAFVLEFYADNIEEQNMGRVCYINNMCRSGKGMELIGQFANIKRESFTFKMFGVVNGLNQSPKTWQCVLDTASNSLYNFCLAEYGPIFNKGKSFDITKLAREKTVFFLNVSDTDASIDAIVSLFHAQVMHELITYADKQKDGILPIPVRIILDDFAASSVIENFDRLISIIRSRELSVSIILQSLSQLETLYSKPQASTIINNCDHILYLGGHDLDTADFMAAHTNKTRTNIMCMPNTNAYLLTNGQIARLVDKFVPYSSTEAFDDRKRNKEDEREV